MSYDYERFFEREIAIRQATHFPPFALIIRVLVEAPEENAAIEALKTIYLGLKEIYDAEREKFYFFNKMRSPVKRLKNKFRYQALMRIRADDEALRGKIFDYALKEKFAGAFVTVEENPSNLS